MPNGKTSISAETYRILPTPWQACRKKSFGFPANVGHLLAFSSDVISCIATGMLSVP